MIISRPGRTFTEGFEGCSLVAYRCPAGVWTIGYGHTDGVKPGDTCTQEQADARLSQDLVLFGDGIGRLIGSAPTTQNQVDALGDMAFNIGLGGFGSSTVLRKHIAGDFQGAAAAFMLWDQAVIGGVLQHVPGLTRRRSAEAAVYLTPQDAHPMPDPAPVAVGTMPQAVGASAGMLWAGMSGAEVGRIELALLKNGLYHGNIDDDFGPALKTSVKAFQAMHGLAVDGVVGRQTMTALGL
jgi:lysozyme